MPKRVLINTGLGLFLAALFSCSGEDNGAGSASESITTNPTDASAGDVRWYEPEQVAAGRQVFADNCAQCHGDAAQGLVEDWRQRLDDGSFPPPPLNGSAHAWHHPLSVLLQVINEGGVPLGGQMPGFADQLNEKEKLAAIAFFQNFWSDEIYASWQQMGGAN